MDQSNFHFDSCLSSAKGQRRASNDFASKSSPNDDAPYFNFLLDVRNQEEELHFLPVPSTTFVPLDIAEVSVIRQYPSNLWVLILPLRFIVHLIDFHFPHFFIRNLLSIDCPVPRQRYPKSGCWLCNLKFEFTIHFVERRKQCKGWKHSQN